ncbi:class I SAM-dependent methyltransferase [Nitratidesulfovibrio liaohensis]|uniref:class I SAM-dependent methyltransferase n=1 Tax=Nitratidesulfovibrio liaohensis TaxID=2604158 RepID=UPI0014246CE7|nr:class I SAM-dependent methyltransferase [Nitratidesulfovibrio liaohensis]NHZ48034.1 class I SAM-dependent methyltransferase [Nitratidesulfovibrio liaohensis]
MFNSTQRICKPHPASFRDPDGYVFEQNGIYYRLVSASYAATYTALMESGCYAACIEQKLLLPHEDVSVAFACAEGEKVLLPEQISCVSYPYEWSFSQLRSAALCTLEILQLALAHNLTLKDASAYNVTWHHGRMIFLDTLSFTVYNEGQPWAGYRQFCSHFLAPLALMHHTDMRCNSLFLRHLDGIPLDLAVKLLPWHTKLSPSLALHIHAHASLQSKNADTRKKVAVTVSKKTLSNLFESLHHLILGLKTPKVKTEWSSYYSDTNYSEAQANQKQTIITGWLQRLNPTRVLDLGSNDGFYSRVAADHAQEVLSVDIDPIAVDANTQRCFAESSTRIHPVLADITTPSPGIGWNGAERASFFERMQADCGMALALVHHLVVGNNVPLTSVFKCLRRLAPVWIVEFVSKEDSQVQRLLCNRPDIFPQYTQQGFEQCAQEFFTIEFSHQITDAHRTLYLLRVCAKGE